jgi:hypothetical protein
MVTIACPRTLRYAHRRQRLHEALGSIQATSKSIIRLEAGKSRKEERIGVVVEMGIHAATTRIDPCLGEIDRLPGSDDANPDLLAPWIVFARPRTVKREGDLGIRRWMIVACQDRGFADVEGAKRRGQTQKAVQFLSPTGPRG